jgi:hypothetical protein
MKSNRRKLVVALALLIGVALTPSVIADSPGSPSGEPSAGGVDALPVIDEVDPFGLIPVLCRVAPECLGFFVLLPAG